MKDRLAASGGEASATSSSISNYVMLELGPPDATLSSTTSSDHKIVVRRREARATEAEAVREKMRTRRRRAKLIRTFA